MRVMSDRNEILIAWLELGLNLVMLWFIGNEASGFILATMDVEETSTFREAVGLQ